MRKLLILPIAMLVVAGLVSPAEAASKSYSLTVKDRAYEYVSPGKYRDQPDIDVSSGHSRDYVLISGRVKRGPVKGKSVRIYATNTNDPKYAKNTYVGKAKLSKKGKFSKRVKPPRGGRWQYKVVIAKSGRYKSKSKIATVDAFHWTNFSELRSTQGIPGIEWQYGADRDVSGPNRNGLEGSRWTNQLAMFGGSAVTFPTKAYRCRKVTVKVGVSDETPDESQTGTFQLVQNGAAKASFTMTKNQTPFDGSGSDSRAKKFRDSVTDKRDMTLRVLSTAPNPQVKFIIGNPKAFCTFPSTN